MDWQARYNELAGGQDAVARALGEVKAVVRQEIMVRGKIASLHSLAVSYVSRQDDGFYAALRSRHEGNASALKIINFFSHDLKLLKVKLHIFEETYLTGHRQPPHKWTADIQGLCQDLWERFQLERDQLFRLVAVDGTSVAS